MSKPAVRRDDFWADAINSLLLRPPYRESLHSSASPDQFVATTVDTSKLATVESAKETPNLASSPAPSFNDDERRSTLGLGPAHRSPSVSHDETIRPEEQLLPGAHSSESDQNILAENDDASPLDSEDTAWESQTEPAEDQEVDDVDPTQPELPQKLRDLVINDLQEAGWGVIPMRVRPRYLAREVLQNEYVDAKLIGHYGFPGITAAIVAMHVRGDKPEVIASNLNTGEDHVQKWIAKAYERFDVHNRKGLLAAIQLIAAKEAEEFAKKVRKKFEKDLIESLANDEPKKRNIRGKQPDEVKERGSRAARHRKPAELDQPLDQSFPA